MINSAEEFCALRVSDDPEEYTRAAYDTASVEVWADVIAKYPDMRFWVAQNKTVPLSILEVLAQDPDENVRSMVARKRKLSESIQLILARDVDPSVRGALARNAKVTPAVLSLLLADTDSDIRRLATERLATRSRNGLTRQPS